MQKNKMENEIYLKLVESYKAKAKKFSKSIVGMKTEQHAGRLEELAELDLLLMENIESLDIEQLEKLKLYRSLAETSYRNNLELTWAGRF